MTLPGRLLAEGAISELSFYFADFVGRQCDKTSSSDSGAPRDLLMLTAALLSESNQRGDVCLDLAALAGQPLFPQLPTLAPPLPEWRTRLLASGCAAEEGGVAPLLLSGNRLYLYRYWQAETGILAAINQRLEGDVTPDVPMLQAALVRLFPTDPAQGTGPDWQKLACALAVSKQFVVISGGPGTGKTTTVVKVLAMLLEQNPAMRLRLAAPTGKAAARMVESIREARSRLSLSPRLLDLMPGEAKTLHRLLGYLPQGFRHHRDNPLPVDCLVIDEASMIDLTLMHAVLDALPAHARVILVGDRDQLASVEAGSVLGDITGHGQTLSYSPQTARQLSALTGYDVGSLPVSESLPPVADAIALLRTSYRFAADSGIGRLARLVNSGDADGALALLQQHGRQGGELPAATAVDLHWSVARSDEAVLKAAMDWAVSRYQHYLRCDEVGEALRRFSAMRILCAVHDGPLGDHALNRSIAERLRSAGLLGSEEYAHGRPVMITVNDYELELYNGDIGLLWRGGDGTLEACFAQVDGQVRHIPAISLPEHVTAWALTVHKS
ncbi:MAG: exodeoxyribonuclease V subunit alpha, partial [Pseudomonas sp.]